MGGSSELEARAARHWRLRRAATGRGAFQGLRVLVSASLEEPFKPEDIRCGAGGPVASLGMDALQLRSSSAPQRFQLLLKFGIRQRSAVLACAATRAGI